MTDDEAPQFVAELSERDEVLMQRALFGQQKYILDRVRYHFSEIESACASDIEAIMGIALCYTFMDRIEQYGKGTRAFIWPQFGAVFPFEIDFIVWPDASTPTWCLGVECDGAAYHSSPKQRKRDSFRDHLIAKRGIRIVRFTGSTIFKAPLECAAIIGRELEKVRSIPADAALFRPLGTLDSNQIAQLALSGA